MARKNDREFKAEAVRLAVGPGGEGFLRFSYAASMERLRQGVRRLEEWRGRQ